MWIIPWNPFLIFFSTWTVLYTINSDFCSLNNKYVRLLFTKKIKIWKRGHASQTPTHTITSTFQTTTQFCLFIIFITCQNSRFMWHSTGFQLRNMKMTTNKIRIFYKAQTSSVNIPTSSNPYSYVAHVRTGVRNRGIYGAPME